MQFFAGSETPLGIEQALQKLYRKFKNTISTGTVPPTREINSGNGLTGGGDLSTNRTISVVANGDGSIVVNVGDIQVGVINDTQHGSLGGGNLHSLATEAVSGFMSSLDKTKLNLLSATGLTVVNTLANLKSINTTGYVEGTTIYLNQYRDFYSLDTTNVYTPNDLGIIKPTTGPGYWISYIEGRWDDQQGDISQGTGGAALTYENFWDTPFKQYFFRYNQNDSLSFRFQLSHQWRRGTEAHCHLHCTLCADPPANQDMIFNGYYVWVPNNEKTPSLAGWTPFNVVYTVNNGDIYDEVLIPLFYATPPVTAKESSILKVFMQRQGTSVLDTYDTNKPWGTGSANLALDSFDIHYIKDKTGTINEIPT